MTRQALSEKKVKALAKRLRLPIRAATVRGNEGHTILLILESGAVVALRSDGKLYIPGEAMTWGGSG